MSHATPVQIEYSEPIRSGEKTPQPEFVWHMEADNPVAQEHSEFIMSLDPTLPMEEVARKVDEKFDNFLCPRCEGPMVLNGENGSGTKSLKCNECGKRPCIWNTYELTIFKHKKILSGLHTKKILGGSSEKIGKLFGIGKGLLDEARMSLPDIQYSKDGQPGIVEYDDTTFGMITIDMMYKGDKGVELGVCGGMNISTIGNETTGEGLDEFFDLVEEKIDVDRYLFILDKHKKVAKKILKRFGKKAIVVLQSHSNWGDVMVQFYRRDEWYSLRLRTDAFTTTSKKSDEESLLAPGEIEFYKNLKYVTARSTLKDFTEGKIKELVEELIIQVGNTKWDSKGRVDLVMRPKISKLKQLLKELKRRDIDITNYLKRLQKMIEDLSSRYESRPGKSTKRKIVNSWKVLDILEDDVERLSKALLKKGLKTKTESESESDSKDSKKTGTRRGAKRRNLMMDG